MGISPSLKDEQLMTLDLDGSLIHIDQEKCQKHYQQIFE